MSEEIENCEMCKALKGYVEFTIKHNPYPIPKKVMDEFLDAWVPHMLIHVLEKYHRNA